MPEQAVLDLTQAWRAALDDEQVDEVGLLLDVELRRLQVSDAARERLRELIEGVWWSGGDGEGGRAEVMAVVREVVPVVAGDIAEPLLALYIRKVCESAWDLTWDHGALLEVLGAAEQAWSEAAPAAGSDAELAVRTMLALRAELTLESSCSTADLRTTARAAREAGTLLHRVRDAVATGSKTPFGGFMADLLAERTAYVDAIAVGAQAAADFLDGVGDDLDHALSTLHAAEEQLADRAQRSELRAHRAAIERLVIARGEDWLRVDAGSVVCLYPFGVRHADQSEVVTTVKTHGAGWSLGGVPLANNPTGLLLIDDMWRGDDPLKRRYEGTQLDLPDLHLLGRDGTTLTAGVTITISQLGNHYVRVELPLEQARPHTLAALVWMVAPEHGNLAELDQHLVFDDAAGVSERALPAEARLCRTVAELLEDLLTELRGSGLPDVALSFRPGMYHVVTTINEASVLPGGDESRALPLDLAARVPTLFGSQSVCHPVPAGVGSLAFWARYRTPLGTAVDCAGLTDEYILVNANQTLIASFSAPEFMVATVGQAAEFAASLDGMFAAWQDELTAFHLTLTPRLRTLRTGEAETLDAELAGLEQEQLRLRQFLTSARVSLLFIASPALVTSPVMRDTVTALLNERQVWVDRTEFTDVAGQALSDRVTDLIEAWVRRRDEARATREEQQARAARAAEEARVAREEEQARRNQLRISTLTAVLAGIGISGVLAMVQEGYAVTQWGSLLLVLLVLLLAALVGYASFRWTRHTGTPREGPP